MHIPGISKNAEATLWRNGALDWDSFFEKRKHLPFNDSKKERIHHHITQSIQAYKNNNFNFFLNIPGREHWRAYPDLKHKCCFLDIETTGLSRYYNDITLIGLYNGKQSKVFINGKNLNRFQNEIKKYDMLVTFNGKCFDIPFIKAKFPNVNLNKFHIDLRFALRPLGFSGGLKLIERDMGINRSNELKDIDGFEAVRLWKRYKKGDANALKLLIKYNIADIENLKTMMDFAFDKLKDREFSF